MVWTMRKCVELGEKLKNSEELYVDFVELWEEKIVWGSWVRNYERIWDENHVKHQVTPVENCEELWGTVRK